MAKPDLGIVEAWNICEATGTYRLSFILVLDGAVNSTFRLCLQATHFGSMDCSVSRHFIYQLYGWLYRGKTNRLAEVIAIRIKQATDHTDEIRFQSVLSAA